MCKILVHSYDDRSFKDKGKNTYMLYQKLYQNNRMTLGISTKGLCETQNTT